MNDKHGDIEAWKGMEINTTLKVNLYLCSQCIFNGML